MSLVAEDSSYGGEVRGLDARILAGGLSVVTSSSDGYTRIYEVVGESLQAANKVKAPAGAPDGVKFSPDGSRLAIAYRGGGVFAINVVRPSDSALVCSPDMSGLQYTIFSVAWSSDGNSLFGSGQKQHNQRVNNTNPLYRWDQGGCGARREIPGGATTILSLHPMHDGGVAFAVPHQIGVVNSAGESRILIGPPPTGWITIASDLSVSNDGRTTCTNRDSIPYCFSTSDRVLTKGADPSALGLRPPDTQSLPITDWEFKSPKLNGRPITLPARSRCIAIAPSRAEFLLATDFVLYLFDSTGLQKWQMRMPDVPMAINVSGDGRTAVVWLSDGTIRWLSMADGKELLAFFLADDHTRWVLWTPSGFYDASPSGEDLIGWNISTSRDAASDFYPASRFHSRFYRPDVAGSILTTLDEAEALRLADAKKGHKPSELTIAQSLPPIISLLSPANHSEFSSNEIQVSYSIRTPSGEPVTNLRILVNGRPLLGAKRIVPVASLGESPNELMVTVPQADCTVSLIAENRFASSEPASVQLRWRGRIDPAAGKPKLFILAIGVSKYPAPNALRFAAKDAQDFAGIMQAQRGRLYAEVETKLITNEQATRDRIIDGFDWLEKNVTPRDVALVLLSGHGVNDTHDDYYFLPVNFEADALRRTAVAFSDIRSTLERLSGKVVFIVDSCHSGNVLGTRSDQNGLTNQLSSPESGVVVFAASTGNQLAAERPELQNGVFTSALVEGLGGAADYTHKGLITVTMLDLYLSERVKELTGGQQTPTTAKPRTIADFAIAALR